ncbi:hypothetical protein M569_13008 [Genlisea aurea]|uniref:Glycosyltransferases n=1 Tax=Genlisea aurea TaxID=192259 RepID=S8C4Z3_9LAMI|nr:hypothetical protein M569_13008 [Genlisea aurea]
MGSSERGSRRVQLWRKATVHFSLCFVMGFLTGFAPTGNPRKFSEQVSKSFPSGYPPEPEVEKIFRQPESHNFDGKKAAAASQGEERSPLLIIVTPTSKAGAPFRGALLGRLASTLKLVAQPFLWVVVEQNGDDSEASEVLRRTGIMYRYIVSKENFSNADTEMDHQRNLALFHIEQHRLTGLVLFAELSTVFDLALFSEMRAIQ